MNIKSAHFLPGTNKRLGTKYLLLECLGDGSHGWVWRAERLSDGHVVAVKIPKDITREDRELAEGKELLTVEPHPNVVQLYEMGRIDNEWFYIEMEYFPSQTLAQKLDSRLQNFGNTFERLFKIYRQVLCAVSYLANLPTPISHGDIKPHNILIGERDLVKLTDFGSSALPEEIYVRTRENGGTVLYAAPEFSNVDCRRGSLGELMLGDIYSLGVLLYQLLTGQLPHDTPSQVQRHAPFKKPSEINLSIHPAMEAVVLRCLEKAPCNRFSSIDELIKDFELACKVQNQQAVPSISSASSHSHEDWSNSVLQAMESQSYTKAAKLAGEEFVRSGDLLALAQQLGALYRGDRLFEFEKLLSENEKAIKGSLDEQAKVIFQLAIKAFLALRKPSVAAVWIDLAKKSGEDSLNLKYLEATLKGLEADYTAARQLLEEVNRAAPMRFYVLNQLIQACEQMRDYPAASGYLKAALKVERSNKELLKKRDLYSKLGVL
ncbi:serine/threonine protein kinase [Microbulbifer sp. OS29]|uniref:Serine/threonine protein kinase n=1 Tax=Microbulbifer okhotskensis TaxID=2926617 RepID=A0A9X2EK53_9GAMM|nr:serine/threonine-protein kinase [Microbulbifer okhotskensis]MCO1333161.1 serine/threonine protein kinase [Microbulbifer okhotskensis]